MSASTHTAAVQLRAKRSEMGMTQREAADFAGLTQSALNAIECGKAKAGPGAAAKLAIAFGIEFPLVKRCRTNADFGDGTYRTWGERIAAKRVSRKMTQAEVAKMCGVSAPAVWAWEHGVSKPSSSRLIALARALLIDPLEMLKGF